MALKYDLKVNSIALEKQSIDSKHKEFVEKMIKVNGVWGGKFSPPAPDAGRELFALIKWSEIFGKDIGLVGDIMYQYRRKFGNDSWHDDRIFLSFNPNKIDYRSLIDDAFPIYASNFDGYFAQITDQEFLYLDYEKSRGIGGRGGLYRLPPVSFMRQDFCERAFNMTPAKIVDKLNGRVEMVREIFDGVQIVLTYNALPTGEMDVLCWKAKEILTSWD